jgi:predicted kinase
LDDVNKMGPLDAQRPNLVIVCGVPGSGKSTLARYVADRSGAVWFASETFAEELGADARTPAGDLSKEAIAHAYSAMALAVEDALASNKTVIAVGSFRSEEQRRRFRDVARRSGVGAVTLRVICPIEIAAKRVRLRRAFGERGPGEEAIRQIDAELNCASDVDITVTNESSIEDFERRIDSAIRVLELGSAYHASPADVPSGEPPI